MVLKGIPSVLSPELLYVLAQMGHGDELGMLAVTIGYYALYFTLMEIV